VLCYIRLLGLVVVGVFADVFDNFAQVVLVVSYQLRVFLLLVEENADCSLLMCEFALEVGYAGSLGATVSVTVVEGLGTGGSTHRRSLCWLLEVRGLLRLQLHESEMIEVSCRHENGIPNRRDPDELTISALGGSTHGEIFSAIDNALRLLSILLQHLTQLYDLLIQQIHVHLLPRNHRYPIHPIAVAIGILLLLLGHGRGCQTRSSA